MINLNNNLWDLIFKIVLIIVMIFLPILTATTITFGYNLYVVKTQEHQNMFIELKRSEQLILTEIDIIHKDLDRLKSGTLNEDTIQ